VLFKNDFVVIKKNNLVIFICYYKKVYYLMTKISAITGDICSSTAVDSAVITVVTLVVAGD